MNWKKFFITFIILYVAGGILGYLIHEVLLGATYESITNVFRPDMDSLMWIQMVTALFLTFFFIYVFAKGYEGKGIMEGVRYGLIIWGFFAIPSIFNQYMVYPIPYSLVWKWLAAELFMFVILGAIMAAVYKPGEGTAK
jgi:hypothetical protein